jgi:hypothetical protein
LGVGSNPGPLTPESCVLPCGPLLIHLIMSRFLKAVFNLTLNQRKRPIGSYYHLVIVISWTESDHMKQHISNVYVRGAVGYCYNLFLCNQGDSEQKWYNLEACNLFQTCTVEAAYCDNGLCYQPIIVIRFHRRRLLPLYNSQLMLSFT